MQLRVELLKIFDSQEIVDYDLRFTVLDARGEREPGMGTGVLRDVLCSFWQEIYLSNTVGTDEVVPSIRYDMTRSDWEAICRIMVYGFRVNYFPIRFSIVFIMSSIFGEDQISESMLIQSFEKYMTLEERQSVEKFIEIQTMDDLLKTLCVYNKFIKPTKENIKFILKNLLTRN